MLTHDLYRIFYNLQTNQLVEFNKVVNSTSHSLETCDILDVLKQPSNQEVCTVTLELRQMLLLLMNVSSAINSDNKKAEEETMGDT
jgi:hypothetical protein